MKYRIIQKSVASRFGLTFKYSVQKKFLFFWYTLRYDWDGTDDGGRKNSFVSSNDANNFLLRYHKLTQNNTTSIFKEITF